MAAVSRGVQAAADSQLASLVHQQVASRRPGAAGASAKAAAKRERQAQLAPLPPLPPPMVTGNYEANATSCHLQVGWSGQVGWSELAAMAGVLGWPGPRGGCVAIKPAPAHALCPLPALPPQEEFESVIGGTSGFKYEARSPKEETFVAQK